MFAKGKSTPAHLHVHGKGQFRNPKMGLQVLEYQTLTPNLRRMENSRVCSGCKNDMSSAKAIRTPTHQQWTILSLTMPFVALRVSTTSCASFTRPW
jgi:hypothetical protein